MKLDLCKLFGVQEGEEFKFSGFNDVFCLKNNELFDVQKINDVDKQYMLSLLPFNTVVDLDIIKLPKKKKFTDDELAILRSIPKDLEYIVRDKNGELWLYSDKPEKFSVYWCGFITEINIGIFNHLFKSICWEDEEPIRINDYVDR